MLSLTVHHNLFLTRDERYRLHAGEDIETIGISIPVWVLKNVTSEPAKEVFCKYILKNPQKNIPININEDGFTIYMPYREGIEMNVSDEEWRFLNMHNPLKLDSLYAQTIQEVSTKSLLDIKDGGSCSLNYREHNKIRRGSDDEVVSVIHFICISAAEDLLL